MAEVYNFFYSILKVMLRNAFQRVKMHNQVKKTRNFFNRGRKIGYITLRILPHRRVRDCVESLVLKWITHFFVLFKGKRQVLSVFLMPDCPYLTSYEISLPL